MEQDFEQQMRDKMDEASLKDLMPRFDKDEEWDQLSERLHPNRRRNIIPMMWSHAAAIVIGVTIGWILLKNTGKESAGANEVARVINTTTPQAAPTTAVTHDTVLREVVRIKEVPSHATGIARTAAPPIIHDTVMIVAQSTVTSPVTADTFKPATVAASAAVATVKRPRPRAVHLLDIDNEDKDLMISADYQDLPKGALHTIQRVIFNQNAMVTADDKASDKPYILRQILKK
jgi:hypothetical protein